MISLKIRGSIYSATYMVQTNREKMITNNNMDFHRAGFKIKINYLKSLNIFVGSGVQLSGLENSDNVNSFNLEEKLVLQNRQFVCHENPQTKV